MAKTRTQKAALNTTTAALAEVVQLICGLILPRLILLNYGSAYNGITSSAKQFLSAISILTVGITGMTRVALYRPLADHDSGKISGIIKATENYMRKVGFVLLGLIVALTIFYPMFVDTGYSWIEVAPLIIAAGVSASGRYFFGITYASLLTADQSLYISNIFSMAANIMNLVASVILIKMGFSVQVVKLASSFVLLLNPVLRAFYVRNKYNLNRRCEPDRSALSMRRDVMAHSIANIVHDHTDVIVLTIFTNVKIVSVYTVYNLVMFTLKKMQRVFTSGTEALFGNMWVKGETEKIKASLDCYEYIIAVFVSVVFSTTAVMLLPFISLYTKGVNDAEYLLPVYALVITSAQAFYSFRTPYVALVQGAGHYKQTKNGAYAEAIINLVLSIILVNIVGIVGVAIGTLAANVFRTLQYAIYTEKNLIPRGKLYFLKRMIWSIANTIIIVLVSRILMSSYSYSDWKDWIIAAVVCTLGSILVTYLSSLIFFRKDLETVMLLIKRGIHRKTSRSIKTR